MASRSKKSTSRAPDNHTPTPAPASVTALTVIPGWEVRVTSCRSPGVRPEPFPRDDFVMALRLGRPDDITVRMAHRPRSFDIRSPTRSSPIQTATEVVGRGLAIGVGLGLLLTASPGAITLTVVGVLALGSAFLSWDR